MVVHDDREDSRQRELGHQERAGGQSHGDELAAGNGKGRGRHLAARVVYSVSFLNRAVPLIRGVTRRPPRRGLCLGGGHSSRRVRRHAARRRPGGVRVRARGLFDGPGHLPPAARAIVSSVGRCAAGVRALHRHLRRRRRRRASCFRRARHVCPDRRSGRHAFRCDRPARAGRRACVPTALTLVFEWTTGAMPANWIRALAGFPIGAAAAWLIARANRTVNPEPRTLNPEP